MPISATNDGDSEFKSLHLQPRFFVFQPLIEYLLSIISGQGIQHAYHTIRVYNKRQLSTDWPIDIDIYLMSRTIFVRSKNRF